MANKNRTPSKRSVQLLYLNPSPEMHHSITWIPVLAPRLCDYATYYGAQWKKKKKKKQSSASICWHEAAAEPPHFFSTRVFHISLQEKGSIKPQAFVCCSAQIRRMELEKSSDVNWSTPVSPPSGHVSLGPKHAPALLLFWGAKWLHWQEGRTPVTVLKTSQSFSYQNKTRMFLQVLFL